MRIPIEADTDGNENLTDFHSKVKEVGFDFPGQNRYTSNIINLRAERAMAGMPNMQGMMKQLQKVQEKIARAQEELEGKTVVGEAGGGMVKVTANGKQHIVKVAIDKEVVNPADVEMLEDLVLAAANKALDDAGKMAQEEMAKATNGMLPSIPGLSMPGL